MADLENIVSYIAIDSVTNALSVLDRIEDAIDGLGRMPNMGRRGALKGVRELVVTHTPYLVIYRTGEDRVEILRVVHGAQDFPARKP